MLLYILVNSNSNVFQMKVYSVVGPFLLISLYQNTSLREGDRVGWKGVQKQAQ